jgi:DNA-binding GntR family transcriptional regulator
MVIPNLTASPNRTKINASLTRQLKTSTFQDAKGSASLDEFGLLGTDHPWLGVSRTPLREALKVLAAEGLVELFPNRGARVRQFTAKDVREFFELLAGMESAAGRLACSRISNAEIAEIEGLHYEMYGHYMRRELPSYFQCNQAIHASIVRAARNEALKSSYQALTARMRQFRYSANTIARDRWGEAMREHEEMLDALRRRDPNGLASILFDHLMRKHEAASQQFRAAEASQKPG